MATLSKPRRVEFAADPALSVSPAQTKRRTSKLKQKNSWPTIGNNKRTPIFLFFSLSKELFVEQIVK